MELEEIMSLSDRILVMYEGRVAAEFVSGEADAERIGFFMTGGSKKDKAPESASGTTIAGGGAL
jgi:ABC-type sugar transport system ATPase subunit